MYNLFLLSDYQKQNKKYWLTLEGIMQKKLHKGMGGGVNQTPPLYFWHHSSDWLDISHI